MAATASDRIVTIKRIDRSPRGRERERVDSVRKSHLPRLAPEYYRGRAFVHWAPTIAHRATGWLNRDFHHAWQLVLLHTCARYELVCPAYVLMPDHAHLLLLGLNDHGSDQRLAIEFLRKHVRPYLGPADWQQQPFDQVLREHERTPDTFLTVAGYVLDNPLRSESCLQAQ
jgi:putative transposase